ncbi:FG-GAP repeat domain-containing protein [Actinoplanes aureus]|uniref:FG-GAP repeat domain-containing protein n=1 Tax=Actinoplanes aureus TaxID=2792083 RepID=UPI0028166175|nr:VCBS repeat-containing protein [Actinoplanes aureus]
MTFADRAIADSLRPYMNGRRLGGLVSGRSIACARVIVRHVQMRGLAQRAAVIAVTTAIAESTLHNRTVAVDHDSLGLFQQRPSQGWGRPDQLVDPGYATDAFLRAMVRKHPGGSWLTGDVGAVCQRVQGSAHPGAYGPEAHDAQLIVARLWSEARTAPSAVPAGPPAAPKPKAPTGPFQRALTTAGTELGPLDGQHDLAMADWNGDDRLDLVVVKGGGAVTGKTDVRIMDGATDFSTLLLNTATALGPTDARHAYSVADWNGDAVPDLLVVQKSGTASGRTEVRIVDGASSFQRLLLETAIGHAAADDRHQFASADWNGDGRLDLVMVQVSGTVSGKMEVQVLDGAADLQRPLAPTATTSEGVGENRQVSVDDWNGDHRPDLVIVQKSGATSGKTELRVLDGASGLRGYLLQARTAQASTDDRHDILTTDRNGDRRPDLVVVQKTGTASGRAEVLVLVG